MIEYMANQYTAIFPFGIVAKGEFLKKEHIDALGEAALADMVKRGVLSCNDIGQKQETFDDGMQADGAEDAEGTIPTANQADNYDTDDPEDIEEEEPIDFGIDLTGDIVDDGSPASPEAEKKPRGGKKK